ncbi:MAG: LLM class flavin-dependent oxidoreductase [Thaumarchaeota archaeon]|nr:LLM class flavin-dependent oxidoreductase [Nitrososphaerota archaeon]
MKTGQNLQGYTYPELSAIWMKAEELGFDSAWLHDHLVSGTNKTTDPTLEAYTTMAALARDTKRLRMGTLVTCLSFRNPAVLAKVGATIDSISGGRFIMGIGTGWDEKEATDYGLSFPPFRERFEQLDEALQIFRLMWTEDSPSFKGKHFSITNAQCYPKPVQKHLPVWVGIDVGTRRMPRLGVEKADGFNSTAPPDLLRKMLDRAEEVRMRTGRAREEVTYSAQMPLLVGSESQVEEILQHLIKRWGVPREDFMKKTRDERWIIGTPEKVAEDLRAYLDVGMEYLVPKIMGDMLLWPLEVVKDKLLPLL